MIFFEEAGCQQNAVGSLRVPAGNSSHNVADDLDCFDNNEADAVLLSGAFPCGGKLVVCDDKADCRADDRATIYLKRPLAPNQAYCVRSFQETFEDEWVKIVYAGGDGLNGDVSRVEVFAADPLGGEEHGVTFQCGPHFIVDSSSELLHGVLITPGHVGGHAYMLVLPE